MRNICPVCKKKRNSKFMQEIPQEIADIAGFDNHIVCEKKVKWREDSTCLEDGLKKAVQIKYKELSKLMDFLTAVKMSNQSRQISLIDMINEIEKGL